MRRIILGLAITCVVAFFATGACAQEKQAETPKAAPPKAAGLPKSPTARIAIAEEILVSFVDETSHHFDLAREYYMKKKYVAASDEMMKAAGFVKLEMARSRGEDERMLADAVERLAMLAESVRNGSAPSIDAMDETFAVTEQALAHHHEMKAQEYWRVEDRKRAGQDLKAATKHLESSLKYGGREAEAEADTVIQDAREFGEKLAKGTALAADKVGRAIQALGRKIEDAGKKMWPPKKQPKGE